MKRFWAYLLTVAMLCSIIALPIQAGEEPYATLRVEDTTAYAGQKVSVYVSTDDCTIRSMGFSPAYPSDKVELLSGRWLIEGDMRAGWDAVSNLPVIAYSQATQVGGDIFVFVFRVFDEVEAGEQIEISLPTVRVRDGEDDLASAVGVSGVITVWTKTSRLPIQPRK